MIWVFCGLLWGCLVLFCHLQEITLDLVVLYLLCLIVLKQDQSSCPVMTVIKEEQEEKEDA